MNQNTVAVNIVGAGLAGLSAAMTFVREGVRVRLISFQPSERAQSNLAEGGINAALNVMGEQDTIREHFLDTMKGGCELADPNMVRNLTQAAPGLVKEMDLLGVPFHREQGRMIQRNFGGQKKKRTAYAKSSTGKMLMAALIDAVRRYEAAGLVTRYPHHRFERLVLDRGAVTGVVICDRFRKEQIRLDGAVLMACGGMNGLFAGETTGTTANTADAQAELLAQGIEFSNLEFLQYHPTTVSITGKRLLISEAARGEGGRLFCYEKEPDMPEAGKTGAGGERGRRIYFLEDKYGERGNLMPRDVISREMVLLGKQVYLDLTGLSRETWAVRLSDLREEIFHYLGIDPAREYVPVSPGIHYFMGGILVDEQHRTNLSGLYAAGECACAYHGANRLGGNSLLGAIFGGRKAALSMMADGRLAADGSGEAAAEGRTRVQELPEAGAVTGEGNGEEYHRTGAEGKEENQIRGKITQILMEGMAPLRDQRTLESALKKLDALAEASEASACLKQTMLLARAFLLSALARRESRGAHTRLDYPETDADLQKNTVVSCADGQIRISFRQIPALRPQTDGNSKSGGKGDRP